VDVAEEEIGFPAAIHTLGGVDLAADQPGMAPAALAAAAVGRSCNAGSFQRTQQGHIAGGSDGLLGACDADGDLEGRGHIGRIVGFLGRAEVFAEELIADELLPQTQGGDLLIHKVAHDLRTADEQGVFALGGILADQVGGDEAMLIALHLLVAEDVHQLDLAALGFQFLQVGLEHGVCQGAAAVEQDQVAVLITIGNGHGQGAEGSDGTAAHNAHHSFGIPQGLVGEVAQRSGYGDLGAYLPGVMDELGGQTAVHLLDGQHKAAAADVIVVGFDKSDAIMGLIADGYILATMAQNPDVMGYEGVKAAVAALKGEDLGGAVTDTGVSVLKAEGGAAEAPAAASNDFKIALITMDRVDQHWVTLEEGAMKAAAELGCEVVNMSPNAKDDAQQIEQINNAVSSGCDAIVVAANGPDAISSALKEAIAAGVKIVYVDSPANVDAEATFSTNNKAAGFTAGETMLAELAAKGITEGAIGIVNINAATDSTVQREAGFREAFEGKGYTLLETQYGEGDAAKSQTIAENYITQGVVGIFGCNEGATNGSGNAVKAAGADVVCVGFDKSDAILGLIEDGFILATMAQNPDVMGYEGIKAACAVLNGENLGGAVTDTGVSVLTK